MEFVEYDPNILEKTRFGLEPNEKGRFVDQSEIDLINVPGVITSQRLPGGYGGGYYDRYLEDFTGKTVSTIYSIQRRSSNQMLFDQAVQEVLVYKLCDVLWAYLVILTCYHHVEHPIWRRLPNGYCYLL